MEQEEIFQEFDIEQIPEPQNINEVILVLNMRHHKFTL